MSAVSTAIRDVVILAPRVFEDERGFFFETWNARGLAAGLGREVELRAGQPFGVAARRAARDALPDRPPAAETGAGRVRPRLRRGGRPAPVVGHVRPLGRDGAVGGQSSPGVRAVRLRTWIRGAL